MEKPLVRKCSFCRVPLFESRIKRTLYCDDICAKQASRMRLAKGKGRKN